MRPAAHRDADGLPGSVRVAEPAPVGARHHRRAAARPRRRPAGTRECAQLLELVGLEPAYARRYPHEFSGGQRQRIGIARALALRARDARARRAGLGARRQRSRRRSSTCWRICSASSGCRYLFIAHDLSVVRHIADRVAVMYLGRIVETGTADELFEPRCIRTPRRCCRRCRSPIRPSSASGADPAGGRRAEPDRPAVGLPLPHPVLEGDRDLCQLDTAARSGNRRDGSHAVACHHPGTMTTDDRRRHTTLGDVARAASVSVATASRSMRDDVQISVETRRRVQGLRNSFGYVANATAEPETPSLDHARPHDARRHRSNSRSDRDWVPAAVRPNSGTRSSSPMGSTRTPLSCRRWPTSWRTRSPAWC